jgi:hypothetical protein
MQLEERPSKLGPISLPHKSKNTEAAKRAAGGGRQVVRNVHSAHPQKATDDHTTCIKARRERHSPRSIPMFITAAAAPRLAKSGSLQVLTLRSDQWAHTLSKITHLVRGGGLVAGGGPGRWQR